MYIIEEVQKIKQMLKNLGLVEVEIKVFHTNTTDPESGYVIDSEFIHIFVEAEDPINSSNYQFVFNPKIRLPDGMEADSTTKLGYCLICGVISFSAQSRCFQCHGLYCKEHTSNEVEEHYWCDNCFKKHKRSEFREKTKDFFFKKRVG